MLFLTYLLVLVTTGTPAPVLTPTELAQHSSFYNGRSVQVKGEAIGDLMLRGKYGWVNISDGLNAIGVFALSEELKKVKNLGGYKISGDLLQVEGVFYTACPDHFGESDIHAYRIEIVKSGFPKEERLGPHKLQLSVLLSFLAIGLFVIRQVFRRVIVGLQK